MNTTRCSCRGVLLDESFSSDELDEHLAREDSVVWADLYRPTQQDLRTVADELNLHTLTIGDAATAR